jgi:tRNA A-37 threonylcarbamoyl transferase component Bud32
MNETTEICPKCGAPVPAEAPQGLCPRCVLAGAAEPAATANPHGTVTEPPPVGRIAAAFPQLEIIELIGAGGMGAVYKARQPKLERFVALKVLSESLAADPAFAERFGREARLLARLNHPNIVAVYDFGQAGGFFFLLMEYVDGVNLREAMAAGRFTPAQALALVPKVCEALQFAHDEGILHRDIKPENILLDVKGRVKIADFGIAKLLGSRPADTQLTLSGTTLGTPHYMAPEQMEHPQEVDQRADIYSLGVVFYEMLTGELPIGRFAPPSEKSPVDPRVDPIVLRALERDRDKRFGSVSEVKTRVENLGPAPAIPAVVPVLPPAPAAKRSGKAVAASVLTATSLVLAVPTVALLSAAVFTVSGTPGRMPWLMLLLMMGLPAVTVGCGLAGFVLGLIALREIRDSRGGLCGKAPAHFALWAWPVLLVLAALPALLVVPYLAVHRVSYETPPPAVEHSAPAVAVSQPAAEANDPEQRIVSADFEVPAGQVAIFTPVQMREGKAVPLPSFGAYALAPSTAAMRGTLLWRRAAPSEAPAGQPPTWSTVVKLESGSSASAGGLRAPAEFAALVSPEPAHLTVTADSESIVRLRLGNGQDSDIGIAVRSARYEPPANALLGGGAAGTGTNWMRGIVRNSPPPRL